MHTKISLYGNCIVDSVYEKTGEGFISFKEERLGGIFNIARALSPNNKVVCSCAINNADLNRDFGFQTLTQVSDRPTSDAEILAFINSHEAQTTIGACNDFQIFPVDANWHHVAYLNTLPRVSKEQLRDLSYYGTVSADLCMGNFKSTEICRIHSLAQEIDFLFMNDHEALSLFKGDVFKNIAKKGTIIHSKDCLVVITPDFNKSFRFKAKPEFNTVGAGDRYVARFIESFLQNQNIEKSAVDAHEE